MVSFARCAAEAAGAGRLTPIPAGVKFFPPPDKGVFRDMDFVTYSSLFQYSLVLVGITAIFLEWFSRKK